MAYAAYAAGGELHESYDNAYKKVKGLWSLARREFGIKETYEFTFAVLNAESIAKLPHPHSHTFKRKDQLPVVVLRLSKEEMLQDLDTILPREMAHIACKINPALGDPYRKDEGWQKVYKKLGGKC